MKIAQVLFIAIYLTAATRAQEGASAAVEVDAHGNTMPTESSEPFLTVAACDARIVQAMEAGRADAHSLQEQATTLQQEIQQAAEDRQKLLEEMEQLRKSLAVARADMEKFQMAAAHQETQTRDAARALKDSNGKASSAIAKVEVLEKQLAEAKEEIERLSSITLAKQIQKELMNMWQSILTMYNKLLKKSDA
jgi:chromosome segregation ATPase